MADTLLTLANLYFLLLNFALPLMAVLCAVAISLALFTKKIYRAVAVLGARNFRDLASGCDGYYFAD